MRVSLQKFQCMVFIFLLFGACIAFPTQSAEKSAYTDDSKIIPNYFSEYSLVTMPARPSYAEIVSGASSRQRLSAARRRPSLPESVHSGILEHLNDRQDFSAFQDRPSSPFNNEPTIKPQKVPAEYFSSSSSASYAQAARKPTWAQIASSGHRELPTASNRVVLSSTDAKQAARQRKNFLNWDELRNSIKEMLPTQRNTLGIFEKATNADHRLTGLGHFQPVENDKKSIELESVFVHSSERVQHLYDILNHEHEFYIHDQVYNMRGKQDKQLALPYITRYLTLVRTMCSAALVEMRWEGKINDEERFAIEDRVKEMIETVVCHLFQDQNFNLYKPRIVAAVILNHIVPDTINNMANWKRRMREVKTGRASPIGSPKRQSRSSPKEEATECSERGIDEGYLCSLLHLELDDHRVYSFGLRKITEAQAYQECIQRIEEALVVSTKVEKSS